MKIEYRQGDMLATDVTHIVHGCNSHGVMGSGVAKMVRAKYPVAYQRYVDEYNCVGLKLGTVIPSIQPDGKVIYNAITQQDYGTNKNVVYVSYWAIAEAFRRIDSANIKKIALPMIGA